MIKRLSLTAIAMTIAIATVPFTNSAIAHPTHNDVSIETQMPGFDTSGLTFNWFGE